ncbi:MULTISPECIES: malonyl-CoA decarboxylase [Halomonadaceae]|uniref:Malonyl-CoA decarboxylase n=1 Tax=Modicisalibacter zincidurans TaxID=1178777 RepID=A0ABP9R100_9GAMM|nr:MULTISPECIES: malonyl-CoA decarboxylase [Halomonas]MCD6007463.1 malonyl-CoA decarboxylase [Halomonas sp. IOP_31]
MNMSFLQELFSTITQRDALRRKRSEALAPVSHAELIAACKALLESDGEASSITLARRALDLYARLGEDDKLRFFERLTGEFSADPEHIDAAYQRYQASRDNRDLQALFDACEPSRQEVLRRLNLTTDGTHELVGMREDLLGLLKAHPDLQPLNADFGHLFGSWFNRGFLVLRRIDWNTPAAILERIIHYEAVHEIQDWNDLRRRLDARDRRCFAFFHPAIGDEPLIFVEVALHRGLPDRIQPILSGTHGVEDPDSVDSAAFFGISNCQTGLRGISFGNFLIKQVVQELKQELPNLRHFVTLSPVPGFRQWLDSLRDSEDRLDDEARETLALLDEPDWHSDPAKADRLRDAIKPLAAHYLLHEKNAQGLPLNPVARFHLGNGAELNRINWLGDVSTKGLQQAAGLMVNYLYVPEEIERNHEHYTTNGTIARSSSVRDLGRRARKLLTGETER